MKYASVTQRSVALPHVNATSTHRYLFDTWNDYSPKK